MKGREEFIKIESIEDLVSFFLNKCIDQEEIYRGKNISVRKKYRRRRRSVAEDKLP